jgi:peptide/nickel transport system permease protein
MDVAEPIPIPDPGKLSLARIGRLERFALGLLLLVTLISLFAPLLAPHTPTAQDFQPYLSPRASAPLGTDDGGRDLLSRTLYGMRTSWFSALAVVASGVLFGGLVGLVAALRGGAVDSVLMRVTDAGLAVPGPVLAIAVAIALGPNLFHTLIAVAIVWWPWYARIIRGEARALIVRPHVDAARTAGAGRLRIALRHVMRGIAPVVLVAASLDLGALILTLAGLSFIGLGAAPPAPELGAMAAQGLDSLFSFPWVPLVPAFAVFVLAAAANLAGDGLRDLLENA